MHMADALISPAVGGTAWAAAAGLIGYSSRKLREEMDDRRIPFMAVLGAFVFAAQMINFTIPATGSSGHLGGGLLLAVLLGPHAGFLAMASVLIVQALFFADGGLLALGCNILNLGVFPCFVAYPLIYRKLAGDHSKRWMVVSGALAAAVAGLQLGSLAVVTQTFLSGISELPFTAFLLVMQPIHLAIGLAEGFATSAVVLFVLNSRPEALVNGNLTGKARSPAPLKGLTAVFLAAAILLGAGLSWFASTNPDGLEWSILRATGNGEIREPDGKVHSLFGSLQDKLSVMPGYTLKGNGAKAARDPEGPVTRPSPEAGSSLPGLIGGLLTLLLAGAAGALIRLSRRRAWGGADGPRQVPE